MSRGGRTGAGVAGCRRARAPRPDRGARRPARRPSPPARPRRPRRRAEIHVYLFDRASGRQYDATEELTVTAELPERRIEPIELEPTKAGPGHYVISGAALGVAGDWTLEIAARVSDFDEYRARIDVPVS